MSTTGMLQPIGQVREYPRGFRCFRTFYFPDVCWDPEWTIPGNGAQHTWHVRDGIRQWTTSGDNSIPTGFKMSSLREYLRIRIHIYDKYRWCCGFFQKEEKCIWFIWYLKGHASPQRRHNLLALPVLSTRFKWTSGADPCKHLGDDFCG